MKWAEEGAWLTYPSKLVPKILNDQPTVYFNSSGMSVIIHVQLDNFVHLSSIPPPPQPATHARTYKKTAMPIHLGVINKRCRSCMTVGGPQSVK